MMLPVNNVLKDLTSRNELFVSLSLCFAGSGTVSPTCRNSPLCHARNIFLHDCVDQHHASRSQGGMMFVLLALALGMTSARSHMRSTLHTPHHTQRSCCSAVAGQEMSAAIAQPVVEAVVRSPSCIGPLSSQLTCHGQGSWSSCTFTSSETHQHSLSHGPHDNPAQSAHSHGPILSLGTAAHPIATLCPWERISPALSLLQPFTPTSCPPDEPAPLRGLPQEGRAVPAARLPEAPGGGRDPHARRVVRALPAPALHRPRHGHAPRGHGAPARRARARGPGGLRGAAADAREQPRRRAHRPRPVRGVPVLRHTQPLAAVQVRPPATTTHSATYLRLESSVPYAWCRDAGVPSCMVPGWSGLCFALRPGTRLGGAIARQQQLAEAPPRTLHWR